MEYIITTEKLIYTCIHEWNFQLPIASGSSGRNTQLENNLDSPKSIAKSIASSFSPGIAAFSGKKNIPFSDRPGKQTPSKILPKERPHGPKDGAARRQSCPFGKNRLWPVTGPYHRPSIIDLL